MSRLVAQVKRGLRVTKHFLMLGCAYVIAALLKLLNNKYRNIWIVSERGTDARDNGYFFYKYLKEQHPEINAWYVIDKSSPDASKIGRLGNLIEYNSFKHYIYYALCKVRISAHAWGGDLPCADYFYKTHSLRARRKKFAFIKHGIIKDYLPHHCGDSIRPDLYACGAKPEYDYVLNNFGHPDGVVQYTGLARFDNLHNVQTKNQILIMPTFRRWLQKMTPDDIQNSDYVLTWNNLLHDERLISYAKKHDMKIVFYPHHVMQPYINFFSAGDSCIEIAKASQYDVQTLLIESKMLVTDFSSVFFDMAYMKKPVMYYQFDRERYLKEHYDTKSGYFDYDTMGFGKVCFEKDVLVSEMVRLMDKSFSLDSVYYERIKSFFPLHDKHNCDRIFEKILQLGGGKT